MTALGAITLASLVQDWLKSSHICARKVKALTLHELSRTPVELAPGPARVAQAEATVPISKQRWSATVRPVPGPSSWRKSRTSDRRLKPRARADRPFELRHGLFLAVKERYAMP